jgi:hypothetical protein
MQVFKDIRTLWTTPFDGADLLTVGSAGASERRPQFSVMILNCESLDWDIEKIVRSLDENRLSYEQLLQEMAVAKNIRTDIGQEWNALEHFSSGTALLHFTDMNTQPWVSRENPLGHLWIRDLIGAIDAGAVSMDLLQQEVAAGHVRPSLLYQVENRVHESLLLPGKARQLDLKFLPPYRSLPSYRRSLGRQVGQRLRAWARRWRHNEKVDHYQRLFHDWLYR